MTNDYDIKNMYEEKLRQIVRFPGNKQEYEEIYGHKVEVMDKHVIDKGISLQRYYIYRNGTIERLVDDEMEAIMHATIQYVYGINGLGQRIAFYYTLWVAC